MTEPNYHQLFLGIANKLFRQGMYHRKQARIARTMAEAAQDEVQADVLFGKADQLDHSAGDCEFMVEKATRFVTPEDLKIIHSIETYKFYPSE